MTVDGKFEIDDETGEKRGNGYYCTTGQIVFLLIVASGLIAGVGCMCFYLPDRTCINNVEPTDSEPTQPDVRTTPAPNEPTASEAPVTDPRSTTKTEGSTVTPTQGGLWNGRLPRDVIPENYELYLKPYLYEEDGGIDRLYTFDGDVEIVMECEVATDVITLHINNITILSNTLEDKTGKEIDITAVTETPEYQFIHFHVGEMLTVGTGYVLKIVYTGELWDGLAGFYRSSYTDANGVTKWLATSQMQPTDARRALPCFDEPDLKAIFYTTIEHRKDMVALSNGKEIDTVATADPNWMKTEYIATPKMSTYLLAFVVGEFEYTETYTENNVRFRVWSRPEAINTTRYALSIGANITDFFEDYFNTPFPLSKQDMIAVPDFSAGAMENWGLIIYRETALLYDERVNSASNQQRVAVVVSHELAHMWFGNLVTPDWWDDLWLNEGFASYVEYLGVNKVEPDWGMLEQFVVADLQDVFEDDSLGTSHPVRVPVNSPDEINEIFDSISYSKGASIIRMLNHFLGEDVFIDGLTYYLNVHREDNANSDDLWFALTRADEDIGGNDVKKIMDTWTLQMGYPVVDLRRTGNIINASQEHFLVNPDAGVDDRYGDLGYLWSVYLTHTHNLERDFSAPSKVWIEVPWAIVGLESSITDGDWYLANINQYGFYRVNYDDDNWAKLSVQLEQEHTIFPRENRAQLINDAFSLARVGRVQYPIALNLTLYLENEEDYTPWEAALGVLTYIRDMFSRYSGYGPLERYMRQQISTLYNVVGWEDGTEKGSHLEQYNRINAIGTACRYRTQDCLDKASALYAVYMANDANNTAGLPDYEINPITPNLKTTVYCYGIQEGGQEEWDFGWMKHQETKDAAEQSKWRSALSCSQAPWILSRYLDYSLDSSLIRKQDSSYVIRYVSQNYVGRSIAWDFLRNEWDTIYDYYGGGSFSFSNIISTVTADFNTELELEELIAFGVGRDFGSAKRTYEQSIEKTQTNIAWMNANAMTVANWLEGAAPPLEM